MDIWKWAEEFNYEADYYDMHTGYTYKVQDYGVTKKRGLPTPGIAVYDGKKLIGYVKEESK